MAENQKTIFERNLEEQDKFEKESVVLTPGQIIRKQFFRNKLAIIGLAIIAFMLILCIIGPFFNPYGEYEIFYIDSKTGKEVRMTDENLSKIDAQVLNKAAPSSSHLLGTDADGRDMLARLMYGGRISLLVGVLVVIIELFIGILLGGIAGYYGGKIDMIIMRLVEIFYSIPFIPLMLIISSVMVSLGIMPKLKIYYIIAVMGVLYWASVARQVRGQILYLREMEYMQAAEATGIKTFGKIVRHLIPNVMPIIILIATIDIGSVILTESVMSFLGVGIAWPYASWGNMANAVSDSIIMKNYMNIWVPPGVCVLLTVLAFNFIGDGLRDAFDPKMRK